MAKTLILLLGFYLVLVSSSSQESSTCLMVYREGGAPAVFESPKCPRWTLSSDDFHRRTVNCHSALLQGRRRTQEDRTFCALNMRIPFPGRTGVKEIDVGMVAVFDGHNGAEASEMASKLLQEYFFLHIYFLLDSIYSIPFKKSIERLLFKGELDAIFQVSNQVIEQDRRNLDHGRSKWILSRIFDGSFHMEILKESLLRTIHDIDATFSKEALENNLEAGTTATIVLIAEGQILVANVGDSKALLCSEDCHSTHELKGTWSKSFGQRRRNYDISPVKEYESSHHFAASEGSTYFYVKELTEDHHPDRHDERVRVEAAGGYVVEWAGVARVNGELALSRAIGDVSFKNFGVISVPEVAGWQPLTSNDSYLVVASDGIFEKMTPQNICKLLWDIQMQIHKKSEAFSTHTESLADCIVKAAFERGSMDNLAAVVVPLGSYTVSDSLVMERCDLEGTTDTSACGLQKLNSKDFAKDAISSGLITMEYANQIMTNFNKLVVEKTHSKLGCFYLSENLNEDMDYVFRSREANKEYDVRDLSQALPEALRNHHSGTLDLYNDRNLCLHFGMDIEGDRGQCINPKGFARFMGLLESIPFYDTNFNSSESFEYDTLDFKYVLKRRFDRGSYGEVWLAFYWNCSREGDSLNWMPQNRTCSMNNLRLDPYEYNMSAQTNSSSHQCSNDSDVDDLFILKRIMVERGTHAYLSGLREKHFGEIFLNASMSLEGTVSSGLSKSFSKETGYGCSDQLQWNMSILRSMKYIWNFANIFTSNSRTSKTYYEEGLKHIARYVESFESRSKEIWLVFRNEGLSLSKLIYKAEETKKITDEVNNIQVLRPSEWWHWLRTTEAGQREMRNLIWQLLMALKSCHDRNITHRDIKPENMVICFEDEDTGRCLRRSPSGDKLYRTKMRIIDFGSAIDEFTIKHLYGSNGPARSEQTYEYTAPEALLNASWFRAPTSVTLKYDMWSVGVVMLELILGSPHVFQISARTRSLVDQHLHGWNEGTKELAYKLRSFMEMCILIPGSSPQHHQRSSGMKNNGGVWPASWKCSEESLSHHVKSRDPLKLGFPNVWALRLVRQLLLWHPEDRLSVDEALQHPYFQPHPQR